MTGLKFGEHIADIIIQKRKIQSERLYHIAEKPSKLNELIIPDFICFGVGIASIVLVVTLSSTMQVNRSVLFAAVFAPIGILFILNNVIYLDHTIIINFFFFILRYFD